MPLLMEVVLVAGMCVHQPHLFCSWTLVPTCSSIPCAWLNVPWLWGFWAALHGDPTFPLYLAPLAVDAEWIGWDVQAVGPGLVAAVSLAAGRSHCWEVESGCRAALALLGVLG